jgi:hypothetical protein
MGQDYFKLQTRLEVQRFEELLHAYEKAHFHAALKHASLVNVFDALQSHPDGGRIFTAFLDIQINFSLLDGETAGIAGTWNACFSKGKLEGGSVLDSPEKFFGKMEIHKFSSGFVLRYRALWDKIMGLLILVYAPERYDNYRRAKSRRKSFLSLSRTIPQIGSDAANAICQNLERFDKTFRTPEMHGTGALRKWSFLMESMDKNPMADMIGFWNYAVETIAYLGRLFESD